VRASRLLSILLLLQTRGRMTAQELADNLEVSVRTIYRDVESLHASGVPLYGDAGPAGGYQLLDGYRTRLTGLTTSEAESLFLAGLPGPAADLGLGGVVAAAQLKLMAALPAPLRDRAGRLQERFHLDAPGWYHDPDPTPHLAAVADAVWNQNRLRVRYRRWTAPQEVTRTIEPYGVVLKGGRWYVVARSSKHIRTYRVSQIQRLTTLDEHFDRPDDFVLAEHWQSYLDEFEARLRAGEAVVRFSPSAVERLPDMMSQATVRAVAAGTRQESGWVEAVIPMESVGHAAGLLLRFGAEVEVLGPPELRNRMAETAVALARLYSTSDG